MTHKIEEIQRLCHDLERLKISETVAINEIERLRKRIEAADRLAEKSDVLDEMEPALNAWTEIAIGTKPEGFIHAMSEMKKARAAYRATEGGE